MPDLLKSNFEHKAIQSVAQDDARDEYRRQALAAIIGSMVFVEDALLYWDCADE
jgi:hypothetical protein